jgi:hypothetical protein
MSARMLAVLLALAPADLAAAASVAGVSVPESATVAGHTLVLNGAGLRKKAVFSVYVGALYLPTRTRSAEEALAHTGAAKVTLKMLRDLAADQLTGAWNEGFANNSSAGELEALRPRIDRFNALFSDVREGELIEVDLVPGTGTTVSIAGKACGTIEGDDFARAVLRIWLGPAPPSAQLKAGMLGGS